MEGDVDAVRETVGVADAVKQPEAVDETDDEPLRLPVLDGDIVGV